MALLILHPSLQAQENSMHHYVMLFRSPHTPTPEEQKARAKEIYEWVQKVTAMGIHLDPRPLGDTIANLSNQGGTTITHTDPTDRTLSILVYFDAPDNTKALEVARIHPGLHYGVTVELREWAPPPPLTGTP